MQDTIGKGAMLAKFEWAMLLSVKSRYFYELVSAGHLSHFKMDLIRAQHEKKTWDKNQASVILQAVGVTLVRCINTLRPKQKYRLHYQMYFFYLKTCAFCLLTDARSSDFPDDILKCREVSDPQMCFQTPGSYHHYLLYTALHWCLLVYILSMETTHSRFIWEVWL